MLNKIASVSLVIAMVCALGGTSVFAKASADLEVETKALESLPEFTRVTKKDSQPNDKLRASMLKLVADAKAGKVIPSEPAQIRPAKSNSLSKGTKIAIGVGIAVAVVVVVVALSNRGPGRVL